MNKDKLKGLAVIFYAKKTVDFNIVNRALNELAGPLCGI